MRDHPDTAAGGPRGRQLIENHMSQAADHEVARLGEYPPAAPQTVPVAMPKARFRREFYGADGYQPLNDRRTRLGPFDVAVLSAIDGARAVDEIHREVTSEPEFASRSVDDVRGVVDRLVRTQLLRWSKIRWADRPVVLEQHEELPGTTDRLSAPINVLWEPSLHCNLHCEFCYNASGPAGERGNQKLEAIRQFADSGALQLTIIGGEPMMMPDFYDMVHHAEELGMSTEFVTNGWFLDEGSVERLSTTEISQLVVSIDGLEETHDRLRGKKGTFKRAIRGVRLLADAGYEVNVTACLQRCNVNEIEPLIDVVAEAGAARIKLRPMVAEGRAQSIFDEAGLTMAEIERYQPLIRRKKEEYRGRMSVAHRMPATEIGLCACDYNPERPGVIAQFKGTCGIGRLQCYVRVDGGVTPNSTLRDHVLGNIFERPFKQIWQDEALWTPVRPPNRAGEGTLNF